ncbi:MAG: lysylphosphatidylglycerol synthase transmembrane domain-containing protein [Cyanobacteria bacterium P01_E01_bin.6]
MPSGLSLKNNWIRAILGLAIGVVFFVLVLQRTSWGQVQDILLQTDSRWVAVAIAAYGISMVIRVERWRLLLWDVKPLSFKAISVALVVGYAMNNILPARLGELFRADFAGRRYELSRSATIGSIALERTLDGLIVVLSLVLGRFFVSQNQLLNTLTIAGMVLFVGIAIALWVMSAGQMSRWMNALPEKIQSRIVSFQSGLSAMRGSQLSRVVGFSLSVWVFEAIAHWSVLNSINVSLNWMQMLSVVGVVNLSTLIPSAPGFAGTYQYAYAFVLGLFSYSTASGIAAATAVQIFLLGSTTLIGLALYSYVNAQSLGTGRSINSNGPAPKEISTKQGRSRR